MLSTTVASLAALISVSIIALTAHAQPEAARPAHEPTPREINPAPLRIGIIGMVHGHVEGLLGQAAQRTDLSIVGIYEPDRAVFDRLAAQYKLDPALYHASLDAMLDTARPEAVSVMGPCAIISRPSRPVLRGRSICSSRSR